MARGDGYSVIKRKRNGRELAYFEVRVQIPAKWQTLVGKKEVLRSTGTGDRRAAHLLAPVIVAELHAAWVRLAGDGLDGGLAPTPDLKAVAVRVGFDGMLRVMEEGRKRWPTDDAAYDANIVRREKQMRQLARRIEDGELSAWERIADAQVQKLGLPIVKGSEEYHTFVKWLAEASVDATSVFTRRANAQFNVAPGSPVVQEVKARESAKAKPGETMLELFERWAAERIAKGKKRLDTVNQERKKIAQFAEFVGKDRSVASITPHDVFEYRERLRDLPPKWQSNKNLRNLPMRRAADKARQLKLPMMEFTTINGHLSAISPLYKWLAKQPQWTGLQNPCNGLFHDDAKGNNPRPPFSTDTLNAILGSPLYTGFLTDGKEHLPGSVRADDWRFWIPLICMFTGARIGEIAQLRVGDVRRERGVWFIHIRHEEGQGLSTKSGKSRTAAVHQTLARIGFLPFTSGN